MSGYSEDTFTPPDEPVGGGEYLRTEHWTMRQEDYDLWKDQW